MRRLVFIFVACMLMLSVCCTGNKASVDDTQKDSSVVVIDSISFFGVHIGDSLMPTIERLAEIRLLKDWDHDEAETYPVDFGGERWGRAFFSFERDVLHSVRFMADADTKRDADSIFNELSGAFGKKYPIFLPKSDSIGELSITYGVEDKYCIWLMTMRDGGTYTIWLEYQNNDLWRRLIEQSKNEI